MPTNANQFSKDKKAQGAPSKGTNRNIIGTPNRLSGNINDIGSRNYQSVNQDPYSPNQMLIRTRNKQGEITKNLVENLKKKEKEVDQFLGFPMVKAFEAAETDAKWFNPKTKKWEQEQPIDNIRHPMAGRYTAEAIASKFPQFLQYTNIPQMAGFLGSTALGIGHELTSNKYANPNNAYYSKYSFWDTLNEAGEDALNNTVGALIGSLPLSDKQKTDAIRYLSDNNLIPDGVANSVANMYFKGYGGDPSLPALTGHYPFGGQYTKTHTHMDDGGWLSNYDTLPTAQDGDEIDDPYFSKGYWGDPNARSKNLVQRQVKKPVVNQPSVNAKPLNISEPQQVNKNIPKDKILDILNKQLYSRSREEDELGLNPELAEAALNVAGIFWYPAAVASSLVDFSQGEWGQGALGLIPFVGSAAKANRARKAINQVSRNLLTRSYNAGIPQRIAAPVITGAKKTVINTANAVNAEQAAKGFYDLYKEGKRQLNKRNVDASFEVGGEWLDMYDPGGETGKDEVKSLPVKSKKQLYQETLKQNYPNYLESHDYITPYTDLTREGDMNCIHGVCEVIQGTGAKSFSENYIGNPTFNDKASKEGYYGVDPTKEGFEIGDILQYARTKKNASLIGRYPGKVTDKNAYDLYPQHAKVILDKKTGPDGKPIYVIGHNKGKDKFLLQDVSEKELVQHFLEGKDTYDGLIVNRYDPDEVEVRKQKKKQDDEILKGNNKYASLYEVLKPSDISIKKEYADVTGKKYQEDYPQADELTKYYLKNYTKLGKSANIHPDTLDKIFHNQIGIAAQESKFGEDMGIKSLVPEALLPTARKLSSRGDDWVEDYWTKNVNSVKSKYKTLDDFRESLQGDSPLNKEAREFMYYHSKPSKGMFQQKELSKRGKYMNTNFDNRENQFLSSMNLAIDNYHTLKNKYPNMSDDELVELTTLMHNAPSKALTKEYVDYYLKNHDIDYVNKVNNQKGLINIKRAAKQIEPTEVEKLKKYITSMKKYGGATNWLDQYEPGGEKKAVNYLDALPKSPNARRDATATAMNQQGRFLDEAMKYNMQKEADYQKTIGDKTGEAEIQFRERYQTSPHAYKYNTDPKYRKDVEAQAKRTGKQFGEIKKKVDIDPNAMFMIPATGITPEGMQEMQEYHGNVIGSALPVAAAEDLLVQGATQLGKVAAKKVGTKIASKLAGKAAKNITSSATKNTSLANINIDPERLKDAKSFLQRRQFIKDLQSKGLIGKDFTAADVNYAARSTDKTNKLTQLALDRDATRFRGVEGSIPIGGKGKQEYTGVEFDMTKPSFGTTISELKNMEYAGVDFNDPVSIAKYQATHVPMQQYGYRSGMPDMKYVDALYAGKSPTGYGNYMIKMQSPRDYSLGNYQDWFNKYNPESRKFNKLAVKYDKGQPYYDSYFVPNTTYDLPILLDNKGTVVGLKGQKMFDVDESYPFMNYKKLSKEDQLKYNEFLNKWEEDYNTGWRGQYQSGGWLDQYQPGGTYSSLYGTPTLNLSPQQIQQTIQSNQQPVYGTPEYAMTKGTGRADYVPVESLLLPASLPIKAASRLGKVAVNVAEAINPLAGLKGTPKKLPNSSNVASSTKSMPKTFAELKGTGHAEDPYYHYRAYVEKKKDIIKHLETPEGRRRLQGYIDKNPNMQNLTPDQIIKDFKNTAFETERPYYRHIDNRGNVEYQPWFEKQIEDAINKGQLDESYRYHPDPARTQSGWIEGKNQKAFSFKIDPNNAYNWYRQGESNPSFISMGQNFTPYDAQHILEHEFGHLFQRNQPVAGVDDVLGNISLKTDKELLKKGFGDMFNYFNPFGRKKDVGVSLSGRLYGTGVENPNRFKGLKSQMDYWLSGSAGQEKAAFAAEVRENMLQRGILKDRYDEITPEMLKKHYDLYHKTTGDKYNLRLYDIMQNNKSNFKHLSEALNNMPAMVPAVGAGYLGYEGLNGLQAEPQEQGYRRGGSYNQKGKLSKKLTTKNVVTGISPLLAKGPMFQKRRALFDPNSKYEQGGESFNQDWLSEYE